MSSHVSSPSTGLRTCRRRGRGVASGAGKKRRSNPRVRWRKKYVEDKQLTRLIDESIKRSSEELNDFIVEYLEKALRAAKRGEKSKARHYISKILRRGHASIIGKRRDKRGRTTLVHHIVVNGKGRVVHEGVHGVRDWEPGKVQFKNKRGEDMEWEQRGPRGRRRGWKKVR